MKPPPPILPALWMRHSEREANGYGGIHRVTAVLEDFEAHVGCEWLLRHHHAVLRAHGFLGGRNCYQG
jgi:hypothetical protein